MCKTISFRMDEAGKIYFFDKQDRLALCKSNPKNYEPDSHTSIADKFSISHDKTDNFELQLKSFTIELDSANNTGKAGKNGDILQVFVNKKGVGWIKELILSSHVVRVGGDCPEWLAPGGILMLPNATTVYCSDNQLKKLELPNATTVYCSNNPKLKSKWNK